MTILKVSTHFVYFMLATTILSITIKAAGVRMETGWGQLSFNLIMNSYCLYKARQLKLLLEINKRIRDVMEEFEKLVQDSREKQEAERNNKNEDSTLL